MSFQTVDSYVQPFAGEQIGTHQPPARASDDLRHAVEYAAWWTRLALDFARGEADAHPGLVERLTAANAQNTAAERLLPHGCHGQPDTSDT